MSEAIVALLKGLSVGEPREACGLQVFGVRCAVVPEELSYYVLDEALEKGLLRVEEVNQWGHVPQLKAINEADLPVFLLVGDQLVGARQNRVVNTSIMLKAKSVEIIPVSCVEQGRWAYRGHDFYGRRFQSTGTAGHYELRRALHFYVRDSIQRRRGFLSDQMGVWREVRRKLREVKSDSASMALEQVYEDHRVSLEELLANHPVPEDAVGAVFAINGKVAGLEMFDKAHTLRMLWPKLIRSYGADVLRATTPKSLAREEVVSWVDAHQNFEFHVAKPPGLGEDVRFGNEVMTGSALVVDGRIIHLTIFPVRKLAVEEVDSD